MIAGFVIVLGAVAYRSAKKRRLGEVKSTTTRQVFEIVLLAALCAAILAQKNLSQLIVTDPVTNVVIPVWVIVAYAVVAFMPRAQKKLKA